MPETIPFRTAYGPHKSVKKETGELSLTKQEMQEECDVNVILRQFHKTGLVTHRRLNPGAYADLAEAPHFLEALIIVREAQESFDTLPSKIRTKFENDPAAFLDFVKNPENAEEMVSLGLARAPAAPVPVAPAPDEMPAPADETSRAAVEPPLGPLDAG